MVPAQGPGGGLRRVALGGFTATAPPVRQTFERLLAVVERPGPVSVLPERTRIAPHARMPFAAFVPRTRWRTGNLVPARRVDRPRFRRIETSSLSNVLHAFRLTSPGEVDAEFLGWLIEAYAVGQLRHRTR